MRLFGIAFLFVFALGCASVLALDHVGTAAGVVLIAASMGLIVLLSFVGAAIASPRRHRRPNLMEGAHYQVRNGVRYPDGFVDFFRALAELSPPDSFLVLGSGAWDRETQDALSKLAVDPGAGLPIPAGFHSDRGVVPITASNMETLAGLADHHASPEIAIHLAAVTADDSWLEWFDATDDPISMSLTLPESAVERFAARVRGDWMACRWLDPVNPT